MYLIDSNIIINGFNNYPPDCFPSYWKMMEEFVQKERFFFHQKVCDEIEKREDEKSRWLTNTVPVHLKLQPTAQELTSYAELTEWALNQSTPQYRNEATRDFLHIADSWLVACAHSRGLCIISNERSSPRSTTKVKIPDAAEAFDVDCISGLEFLRREKLQF